MPNLQPIATRPGVAKSRNALIDVYNDQVYVDDRTIDKHINAHCSVALQCVDIDKGAPRTRKAVPLCAPIAVEYSANDSTRASDSAARLGVSDRPQTGPTRPDSVQDMRRAGAALWRSRFQQVV
jgi:hypothetical protein